MEETASALLLPSISVTVPLDSLGLDVKHQLLVSLFLKWCVPEMVFFPKIKYFLLKIHHTKTA